MRPTKYSKEMLAKASEYLDKYEQLGDMIPSAAGMSCHLGVAKSTLYKWAELHDQFSDTLKVMNSTQERRLLSGGLSGDFNSMITKLVLSNHNYSDKVQQEVSSPDGSLKPTHIILEGVSANTSTDT